MAADIKKLPLSKLHPNTGQLQDMGLPKNPRFIRDEKFKLLVKSLQEDPEMLELRELIVYDSPAHGYIIVGGNMRYRAAKDIGMKEIPCKILPPETPVEKLRAYTIKDNAAFGDNDWDLLANEWDTDELADWGLDLPEFCSPDDFGEDFELADGDKSPFQQMAFTLADKQAELIRAAIKSVQQSPNFGNVESYGNSNTNGNALFLIVKQWAEQKK